MNLKQFTKISLISSAVGIGLVLVFFAGAYTQFNTLYEKYGFIDKEYWTCVIEKEEPKKK